MVHTTSGTEKVYLVFKAAYLRPDPEVAVEVDPVPDAFGNRAAISVARDEAFAPSGASDATSMNGSFSGRGAGSITGRYSATSSDAGESIGYFTASASVSIY